MSNGYYTIFKQNNHLYNYYDLRFGTAKKLTADKESSPVMGFGLIVDNGIVDKTIRISNRGAVSNLNFDAYWNNVFAKYE